MLHVFIFPISRILYSILSLYKNTGKPYIAMVRSAVCLLRRFSSLSFGLQITLRCIHAVFQSSTIYIRHNHMCFFIRISETQQLFSHPLSPSIYLWLELFFFIHLSLFRALWIFSRKLMERAAIPAMLVLQEIDIFNKKNCDHMLILDFHIYLTDFVHLHLKLSRQRRILRIVSALNRLREKYNKSGNNERK